MKAAVGAPYNMPAARRSLRSWLRRALSQRSSSDKRVRCIVLVQLTLGMPS